MARLSEADAVRLAARFGRAPQEFAGIAGMTVAEAAAHLALDEASLQEALGKNAAREPSEVSGAERVAKKATKKAAKSPRKAAK